MNQTRSRLAALTAGFASVVPLAACGDAGETVASPPPRSTVGVSEPASATEDPSGPLSIGAVPGWEDRVEVLTQGSSGTPVEIDWDWQDAHAGAAIEHDIISAVAAGELDLGFVGTRAFSAEGVHAFDALTAPFLVDSYELEQAILDSDIATRLLPALDELGVTGLALTGGPLRYLLGVEAAPTEPEDFAGIVFHTWRADTNAATAIALGADHTDVYGDERDTGLVDGTINATENSLAWAVSNGRASHATVNAALWPAFAVLIANPQVVDALADRGASLTHSISVAPADLADSDKRLIDELCAHGKQLAEASPDDVAALRAAVEPVYADLAEEPATAALLEEITALKRTVTGTPLTLPDDCGRRPSGTAAPAATDNPSVLNGSYRLEWTVDELVAAGVAERDARGNAGGFVLTFTDGAFDQVWENDPSGNCPGTYTVHGDRLTMVAADDFAVWNCGGDSLGAVLVDATWRLDGDQLVLSDFRLSEEPDVTWWNAMFLAKPLIRIE